LTNILIFCLPGLFSLERKGKDILFYLTELCVFHRRKFFKTYFNSISELYEWGTSTLPVQSSLSWPSWLGSILWKNGELLIRIHKPILLVNLISPWKVWKMYKRALFSGPGCLSKLLQHFNLISIHIIVLVFCQSWVVLLEINIIFQAKSPTRILFCTVWIWIT
jgi:hypothetical protein